MWVTCTLLGLMVCVVILLSCATWATQQTTGTLRMLSCVHDPPSLKLCCVFSPSYCSQGVLLLQVMQGSAIRSVWSLTGVWLSVCRTETGKNYEQTLEDVKTYSVQQKIPYQYILLDR